MCIVTRWGGLLLQTLAKMWRHKLRAFLPMFGIASLWDTVKSAALYAKVFDATGIFLAIVALITLALGGVGVTNTMMMTAVAERTTK